MSANIYFDTMAKEPLLTKEQEASIGEKLYFLRNKLKETQESINSLEKDKKDKSTYKFYLKQFKSYKKQYNEYRNQMVQRNLRLVFSIAKKYKAESIDIMDLVEEGNIGLIKAIDRFDYRKGYRLSTFATWWIRKIIIEYIKEKNQVIRIPTYIQKKMTDIRRVIDHYQNANNNQPMFNELSKVTGFKTKDIAFIFDTSKNVLSLNLLEERSNDTTDVFRDKNDAYNPENNALKNSFEELLGKALASLSEMERKILIMYFGLKQMEPVILNEIGVRLGVTRERVRQVKNEAMNKIKNSPIGNELKYFMA